MKPAFAERRGRRASCSSQEEHVLKLDDTDAYKACRAGLLLARGACIETKPMRVSATSSLLLLARGACIETGTADFERGRRGPVAPRKRSMY